MTLSAVTAYREVSDTPARARALPGAAYGDPAVFAAETLGVFRAGWVPVARENALARAGDYRCVDVAGAPLVVTRDAAGALHVLSSVCRHRGFPVITGAGNVRSLTCPYHLWRYGLDGGFLTAPAMDRSELFDPLACALPRIRSETWGGWVFANVDGKAEPLGPQIEALTRRMAPIDMAGLATAAVLEWESPWNWKIMVENFLESYHHIGPHAESLQRSNPGLGTFEGMGGPLFTVLDNPPADETHAPFMVGTVFPAFLFSFGEGANVFGVWYELDRIELARFTLRIHLLLPPDMAADPAVVERYKALSTVIHTEDIPACAGVQAGVLSPLYAPGPLSHLEAPLWRFHRFLRDRLG